MKSIFNKKILYHIIFFSICQFSFLYAWYLILVHGNYTYTVAAIEKIVVINELAILGLISFTKLLDLSIKEKDNLFIDNNSRFVGGILLIVEIPLIFVMFFKFQSINTLSPLVKIKSIIFVATVLYMTLFATSYFFHLDLRKFSLKINAKTFFCILIIFLSYFLPRFIFGQVSWLNYYTEVTKSIPGTMLKLIGTFFYPAAIEEYLYRGVILSALLSFNMENWKANIIQATIFGLTHICENYNQGFNLQLAILFTSVQILLGYAFGKISLKTNSLMPGIILHVLIDTFNP